MPSLVGGHAVIPHGRHPLPRALRVRHFVIVVLPLAGPLHGPPVEDRLGADDAHIPVDADLGPEGLRDVL
jgi:hypothetical protein